MNSIAVLNSAQQVVVATPQHQLEHGALLAREQLAQHLQPCGADAAVLAHCGAVTTKQQNVMMLLYPTQLPACSPLRIRCVGVGEVKDKRVFDK